MKRAEGIKNFTWITIKIMRYGFRPWQLSDKYAISQLPDGNTLILGRNTISTKREEIT